VETVAQELSEEIEKGETPFLLEKFLSMTGTQRRRAASSWEANIKEVSRSDRRQPVRPSALPPYPSGAPTPAADGSL